MRVCLLNPPTILAVKSLSFHGAVLPIGLAYIAAFIKKAGYNIQVIDATGEAVNDFRTFDSDLGLIAQGLSFDQICQRIPTDTQVIGITQMFLHEYYMIKALVARLKKEFPNAVLVIGGENASAFYEQILKTIPEIDFVVRGEGELKFLKLLDALKENKPVDIRGIAYRNEHGIVETGIGDRQVNIDEIPWPAWDLFPMQNYFDNNLSSGVNRGRSISM